jgi:hypothetical protein
MLSPLQKADGKSLASRGSYPALRGKLARPVGVTNPENAEADWQKAQ